MPHDTAALLQRLAPLYPVLTDMPAALRDEALSGDALVAQVPAGNLLFEEGAPCRGFPMVLAGEVRVARGTPHGRSIELYRVTPGELCVASTSCLFGHTTLTAHGITAADTELVALSPPAFARWTEYEPFRRYVFGVFADRLADLMALAEAVAFQRLDQRLAATLLGHGRSIHLTHQALADSLGTVREIVTRLLKRFEQSGWVALSREHVEVLDPAALRALAAGQEPTRQKSAE